MNTQLMKFDRNRDVLLRGSFFGTETGVPEPVAKTSPRTPSLTSILRKTTAMSSL